MGVLIVLAVWIAASVPVAVVTGRVLSRIADDYPPLDGESECDECDCCYASASNQ